MDIPDVLVLDQDLIPSDSCSVASEEEVDGSSWSSIFIPGRGHDQALGPSIISAGKYVP